MNDNKDKKKDEEGDGMSVCAKPGNVSIEISKKHSKEFLEQKPSPKFIESMEQFKRHQEKHEK